MRLSRCIRLASLVLALGSWSTFPSSAQQPAVHEHVERRLIQLDVSVRGPQEVIPRLAAEDFDLVIGNLALGGRTIADLTLDAFCDSPVSPRPPSAESPTSRREVAAPRASYVFYFDRTISQFAGHEGTHRMVRDLIDALVDERSPATIVSGGRTVRTYAFNTADRDALYAALERLQVEASRQDDAIAYPQTRLWDVREAMRWSAVPRVFARERAHRFQKEAIDRTYVALTRLSAVMPGLADLPLPKVLFYIGDRLNSRPGQIYFTVRDRPFDALDIGDTDPWAAARDFELVIQDAATSGVRIYPIFPAGPTHSLDSEYMQALRASHWSMRGLAEQTGGQEFFWGVPVGKIVKKVEADLSCTYLLSFDPTDLPEDVRLGVDLRVNRPKVDARTRPQIVVRSREQHREAELLAAFLAEDEAGAGGSLTAEIIVDSEPREEAGVLRVTLPASTAPGREWRLGVWLVREGVVHPRIADSATGMAGSPVVVEYPMRFPHGPFELILLAHEPQGERVLSTRLSSQGRSAVSPTTPAAPRR